MSFIDWFKPAVGGALLLISALAIPPVWSSEIPLVYVSGQPSCILYEGDNGVRALVDGGLKISDQREAGGRLRFLLDGQTFSVNTDDRGNYTLDVPVSSMSPKQLITDRAWDHTGRMTGGNIVTTACTVPQVHVGPLESVK